MKFKKQIKFKESQAVFPEATHKIIELNYKPAKNITISVGIFLDESDKDYYDKLIFHVPSTKLDEENSDENGFIEIPNPAFDEFFSETELKKGNRCLMSNSIDYLKTLEYFQDAIYEE